MKTHLALIVLLLPLQGALGQTDTLFTTITFRSADSLLVTADLYRAAQADAPIVLLMHRSASSRGQYRTTAPRLAAAGFHALAIDLRWGGPANALSQLDNATAKRYGVFGWLPDFANQQERVWATIAAAYQDVVAAVYALRDVGLYGPVIPWGSSASTYHALHLAADFPEAVSAAIVYSPGEYHPEDSTLAQRYAKRIRCPVYVAAGVGEEDLTRPIFDAIPHYNKTFYQAIRGRHGAAILDEDETNWESVLTFLSTYAR